MIIDVDGEAVYACNFCRKRQDDVAILIASPYREHICNECVEACAKMIATPTPQRGSVTR